MATFHGILLTFLLHIVSCVVGHVSVTCPHLLASGCRCAGCPTGGIRLCTDIRNFPSCSRRSADIRRFPPRTRPHLQNDNTVNTVNTVQPAVSCYIIESDSPKHNLKSTLNPNDYFSLSIKPVFNQAQFIHCPFTLATITKISMTGPRGVVVYGD